MKLLYRELLEAYRGLPAKQANGYIKEAIGDGNINVDSFSLTELFSECFGYSALNECRNRHALVNQYMEAGDAVTSAAFSNISGQIVFSATMDSFNLESTWASELIPTIQSNFKSEKIPGISEIGDQAAVKDEGEEYVTVGVSEDYIETPDTQTRGMIIPVTREAILFDRTNLLLERARNIGQWMGRNKEKRLIDMIVDENTTRHRYNWKGTVYASYVDTPWDNLHTADLVDYTDIDEALQLFDAMTDPATGEPLGIVPKHLIVTAEKHATAFRVMNTTEVRQGTISASVPVHMSPSPVGTYRILTGALLASRMADDTDWFLGDVTMYGKYIQNWPMTVTQAPANSELEFTREIVMRFKASERGSAVVTQPRAIVKADVA